MHSELQENFSLYGKLFMVGFLFLFAFMFGGVAIGIVKKWVGDAERADIGSGVKPIMLLLTFISFALLSISFSIGVVSLVVDVWLHIFSTIVFF